MSDLIQLTPPPTQVARDDFWVLARAAVYLRGKGVTFGPPLLTEAAINQGVYSIPMALHRLGRVALQDNNFGIFADGSLDHILVTPMLAGLTDPNIFLREAVRKLKMGGHLILLTPLKQLAPDHIAFEPSATRAAIRELAHWGVKCDHVERDKHLLILKKVEGRKGWDVAAKPVGQKRVCVTRYGALGDAIIMTPLLRQLKEDGYHVTLNISSYCAPVFENNPHIDNILIQERDLIPNQMLGRYWRFWEGEYDRFINLSESLEGDLLVVENRPPFYTSREWRHERCNRNYYDYTLERGGYPQATGRRGELFFTEAEERRARRAFEPLAGKFNILWAINGSSHHKVYPMLEATMREWFREHSDSRLITTGDVTARGNEFPHWQCVPRAGLWSIRESLIATKYASVVIGPETMITNASGCFSTPKIVLLSHSSRENLTKYFLGDHSLEPDRATAPCYPCHQLHYSKESCPLGTLEDTSTGETLGQAPVCTLAISPEWVLAELDVIYAAWKGRGVGA